MSTTSVWIYGCLGGFLPVIVRVAKATFADAPAFKLTGRVVIGALAMAFLGGLIASLLNLEKIEIPNGTPKLTVLLVGYASLDLLASLAGIIGDKIVPPTPTPNPTPNNPTVNLNRFLRT